MFSIKYTLVYLIILLDFRPRSSVNGGTTVKKSIVKWSIVKYRMEAIKDVYLSVKASSTAFWMTLLEFVAPEIVSTFTFCFVNISCVMLLAFSPRSFL